MKAYPALRLAASLGLSLLCFAPKSSAQLFHIVAKDSFSGVDSVNNSGIALNAKFEFNYGGAGILQLTLTNLGGTLRPASEGGGHYASGILTQFGFDTPAGMSLISASSKYSYGLAPGSASEPGGIKFNLDYPQTIGAWGFDFGADATSNSKGLAGGYSAIFTFKFTGNLTYFNEAGFFAHNGSDADMGFRFDGLVGCPPTWDKVAYWVNDCDIPPIPEPSTYGFAAASLLVGMAGMKRYRARKLK